MQYPDWFEVMWKAYPKRPGNSKAAAWRQVQARINQGSSIDDMYEGTLRYKAYCDACGFTETNSTKMARTFYGQDMHYDLEWEIPNATSNRGLSAVERVKQANASHGHTAPDYRPAMGSDDADVWGTMAPQLRLIG